VLFDSHGPAGFEFLKAFGKAFAHLHHIAASHGRDTQPDGRFAVKAHERPGGLLVTALNVGHISQIDQTVRSRPPGADEQIPEFLFRSKLAGGVDCNVLFSKG